MRRCIVLFASAWLVAAAPAVADGQDLLWQLNSAGDDIHVVDAADGRLVRRIAVGPEPHGIATPADSRGLFFQQVDGLHGFQVADVARRRVVATVEHRGRLGWFLLPIKKLGWLGPKGLQRCHGLEVRPGEEEIWSTCGERANVHALDETEFPQVASIELPSDGYWLTFSPDGRYAFVALTEEDGVAVVDAGSREIVRYVEVGYGPKRNLVVPGEAPSSDRVP